MLNLDPPYGVFPHPTISPHHRKQNEKSKQFLLTFVHEKIRSLYICMIQVPGKPETSQVGLDSSSSSDGPDAPSQLAKQAWLIIYLVNVPTEYYILRRFARPLEVVRRSSENSKSVRDSKLRFIRNLSFFKYEARGKFALLAAR